MGYLSKGERTCNLSLRILLDKEDMLAKQEKWDSDLRLSDKLALSNTPSQDQQYVRCSPLIKIILDNNEEEGETWKYGEYFIILEM